MIITQLPNSSPYTYTSGNAVKELGPSLPEIPVDENNDICICDYIQCQYIEKVFASQSPNNEWYKNDKNEFLFRRFVTTDTVDIELYKDEVKIEDLNTNTFGTFYNGFPSGNTEQQLYVGFLLDWELVQATYGNGFYQVKAQLNIIGVASTYESRTFNLLQYSDIDANKTVRIESYQDGNIFGSSFDFTGLNWYQSLRLPGTFGNPTPVLETDNYINSNHESRQITAKNSREWSLTTGLINYEVGTKLLYNKLLANRILITDYLIKAESIFRRVDVIVQEIDKPEIKGIPDRSYNAKFTDRLDKFRKRNF
jgi:hypothetical protein